MAKKALGRGLEALIPTGFADSSEESLAHLPLEQIHANPWQPRQDFDEAGIEGLAASFASSGILQPIVVQKSARGYELIAGERRLRAAKKAGWESIPAMIIEADEQRGLQLALVENIQRENLNPMEEALAYRKLIQASGSTQEELAGIVGKERSTVSNSLRLLKLPSQVQQRLREGAISSGHARAILSLGNPREQLKLCQSVIDKGLSVRQVEDYVRTKAQEGAKTKADEQPKAPLEPLLQSIQEKMTQRLVTRVKITPAAKGEGGKILIEYYSAEDLERVLQVMQIT